MATVRPGELIAVMYDAEPDLAHARLPLRATSPATIAEEGGDQADDWQWILTPDGDIYPEALRADHVLRRFALSEMGGDHQGHGGPAYGWETVAPGLRVRRRAAPDSDGGASLPSSRE